MVHHEDRPTAIESVLEVLNEHGRAGFAGRSFACEDGWVGPSTTTACRAGTASRR
jgi:hypothetical protein